MFPTSRASQILASTISRCYGGLPSRRGRMDYVWTCQCCGKQYNALPFGYALDEPDPWRAVPEVERAQRGELSSDACVIDGRQFCIRARLEIPVRGYKESFIWGIWVSVT